MMMKTDIGQFVSAVAMTEGQLKSAQEEYRREQVYLGNQARAAREKAGLSVREVARRMKISAPFLSGMERGNRHWTEKQAEKWKEAMK
jgi:ribosome-binding protein aMBF1 (putative translation factor)